MTKSPPDAKSGNPSESPFEAAKPEETLPLLQSAIARKSKLQCWSPGQKHSYTSRIVKVNETAGLVSVSVSKEFPGGEEFEAALIQEACEEILFSLQLPTDIIFFKAELRRGESGYFTARVKAPLFKIQRRESLRLPISGNSSKVVHIQPKSGPAVRAELVNLSEGGIAISMTAKSDYESLAADKSPVMISFEVNGISVTTEALVRHGFEAGSTMVKKAFRLGIAFKDMDPKLRERLSQLVFEESAKFLGRY